MIGVNLHAAVIARFMRKVATGDGCWLWLGRRDKAGYGRFDLRRAKGERTRPELAHRVSYLIHVGAISDGLDVCHSCDVPRCVKPAHMFVGTHQENMRDMSMKGRAAVGERSASHKLTGGEVIRIRAMLAEGETTRKVAQLFGIAQSVVSDIGTKKSWVNV